MSFFSAVGNRIKLSVELEDLKTRRNELNKEFNNRKEAFVSKPKVKFDKEKAYLTELLTSQSEKIKELNNYNKIVGHGDEDGTILCRSIFSEVINNLEIFTSSLENSIKRFDDMPKSKEEIAFEEATAEYDKKTKEINDRLSEIRKIIHN
jgi:hypothetical protein